MSELGGVAEPTSPSADFNAGCCDGPEWRGHLCQYHAGYADGFYEAQIAARVVPSPQPDASDFYEEDEPIEKIRADFAAGEKGITIGSQHNVTFKDNTFAPDSEKP